MLGSPENWERGRQPHFVLLWDVVGHIPSAILLESLSAREEGSRVPVLAESEQHEVGGPIGVDRPQGSLVVGSRVVGRDHLTPGWAMEGGPYMIEKGLRGHLAVASIVVPRNPALVGKPYVDLRPVDVATIPQSPVGRLGRAPAREAQCDSRLGGDAICDFFRYGVGQIVGRAMNDLLHGSRR